MRLRISSRSYGECSSSLQNVRREVFQLKGRGGYRNTVPREQSTMTKSFGFGGFCLVCSNARLVVTKIPHNLNMSMDEQGACLLCFGSVLFDIPIIGHCSLRARKEKRCYLAVSLISSCSFFRPLTVPVAMQTEKDTQSNFAIRNVK